MLKEDEKHVKSGTIKGLLVAFLEEIVKVPCRTMFHAQSWFKTRTLKESIEEPL